MTCSNRLQAVTSSHGSAKSVYKNGFRRVVGAALPKPNGARASRPQQSRRLTGHAIIRSFSGLRMCCGQDGRALGFRQSASRCTRRESFPCRQEQLRSGETLNHPESLAGTIQFGKGARASRPQLSASGRKHSDARKNTENTFW